MTRPWSSDSETPPPQILLAFIICQNNHAVDHCSSDVGPILIQDDNSEVDVDKEKETSLVIGNFILVFLDNFFFTLTCVQTSPISA